MTGTTNLAL
jgi:hypothetical protein